MFPWKLIIQSQANSSSLVMQSHVTTPTATPTPLTILSAHIRYQPQSLCLSEVQGGRVLVEGGQLGLLRTFGRKNNICGRKCIHFDHCCQQLYFPLHDSWIYIEHTPPHCYLLKHFLFPALCNLHSPRRLKHSVETSFRVMHLSLSLNPVLLHAQRRVLSFVLQLT